MWETSRLSAGGGFSLRKIVIMFLAVVCSALFMAIANSTDTFAQSATWDGDNLKVGDKTYTKMPNPPAFPGISPTNNQIYLSENGNNVSVIALKDGFDKSREITDAQTGEFVRDASGNYSTRPGTDPPSALTVAASDGAAAAEGTETNPGATSCAVQGIGWIICGPSKFIAQGMDKIYEWINGFLTIKPLTTDTNSGIYNAWEIARGLANACFILAFLAIIYAQITSYGISNYEIKKMIPKLIVAAILVNVSYFICAAAIDLSNILGDSVQKALIDVRNTVVQYNPSGGGSATSFEDWTEYFLSGGTLLAGGIAGSALLVSATGGSVVALVFLLLPVLVSGLLSVVVALAILAARQAIVTVLIVLSPLAFVAYLLPNTEKWFEKWRGIFTTMLLVFPMFSLLFGGSQLASALILQNTDQLSVVILALFVQVAPLIVTPFLIQFSGSLLGRFAGMVNNPNKGIVDRTRNWSQGYADRYSARGKVLGQNSRFGARKWAFKREMDKKKDEDKLKGYNESLDASWAEDKRSHKIGVQAKYAEMRKAAAHAETERDFEKDLVRTGNTVGQHIRARQYAAEGAVKNMKTRSEIAWTEAGTEDMLAGNPYAAFHDQAKAQARDAQVYGYRMGTAQVMQKIDYANAITGGDGSNQALATADALARQAAGVDVTTGPDSARASAVNVLKKSKLDSIAEGRALSQHYNLTSGDRQKLAKGISVTGYDNNGVARTFTSADSEYVQLSAIEDQISQGTVEEAVELIMQSGQGRNLYQHREVIVDAMIKGGIPQKAAFFGGKALDDIRAGRMVNTSDLYTSAASQVAKGKLSAEVLLNQDKTSMEIFVDAVEQVANGQVLLDGDQAIALPVELDRLFASADRAINDPRINTRLGERKNAMQRLANMMHTGTAYTPPRPGGAAGPAGGAGTPPPAGPAGGGPAGGGTPTPGTPGGAAATPPTPPGTGPTAYPDPDDDFDDIDDALYDL